MNDTEPVISEKYLEMLMRLPPQERLKMAGRLFSDARKLVEASIRLEMRNITDMEMKVELLKRFYGSDFSEVELSTIIAGLRRPPQL